MNSITEILKYSYNVNPESGTLIYRGQANQEWPLIPSVFRRFERYQAVVLEACLLNVFYAESINKPHIYTNNPVEFLAMCQHYDIPTRLMDWTDKVLTALFFACEDIFDKSRNKIHADGALYICNKEKFNKIQLNKFEETTTEPLLIENNFINPRMNAQSGSFMMWGMIPINPKTIETYTLYEYCESVLEENPIEKIIIPKEKKAEFLTELNDVYGINNNTLYLNNNITKQVEEQYRMFKKTAALITYEMTKTDTAKSFFNLGINIGGNPNIHGLKLPRNFPEIISSIMSYGKDLVDRNAPCVCRSGKKYKNCCK